MPWHRILDADVLAIAFGCGIPIVAIISFYFFESNKHRLDSELKRAMIDRGMSSDEIVRVLAAGTDDAAKNRQRTLAKPHATDPRTTT